MLLVAAVKGPLYSAIGVAPAERFYRVLPLLHHVAAHTAEGTPLTDDERELLERLHPLDHGEWPYHPSSLDRLIWWTGKFQHAEASEHAEEIGEFAARARDAAAGGRPAAYRSQQHDDVAHSPHG